MQQLYRIALAFPHEHGTVKGLYKGILEYAEDFPLFAFRHTGPNDLHGVRQLKGWKGDGVIASINSRNALDILDSLDCPVVNISGALENSKHPRVIRDLFEVGRTAAQHLASTGVKSFGYVGIRNRWYSERKRDGFRHFLQKAGLPPHELFIDKIQNLKNEEQAFSLIGKWFDTLEFPVGILLDTDSFYGIICELCMERGLSIPDDVPVVGINNFPAICLTRSPTLTSIEQSDTQYGYNALKMLHDHIIHPQSVKTNEIIIKSHRLLARASTAVTFVENPKLNEAIKFIRGNLGTYFSMDDVVAVTGCSRRWLETSFKAHLGSTPASYIQVLRIQKAKQLIADYPRLDLHEISTKCGFSSKRHMVDVFRKVENVDPVDLK